MRYYSHTSPILYSTMKTVLNKLSMVIKSAVNTDIACTYGEW